jgi:hypothetical protein
LLERLFYNGSRLATKLDYEKYVTQLGIIDDMSFTLDDVLPIIGKPIEGNNNRKQVGLGVDLMNQYPP